MKVQKLSLAYFSPNLNTKRVTMNIGLGLGLKNTPTAELNLTKRAVREQPHSFGPEELVVVSAPVYGGRLPVPTPGLLGGLQGQGTPAVAVVVYGNQAYGDALLELKESLEQRGFRVVGAAAFVAQHSKSAKVGTGRPDAADMGKILAFASAVKAKLEPLSQQEMDALPAMEVPGNSPYKELPQSPPMAPHTDDKCIYCMQCYRWCPEVAIAYNDPMATDPQLCIKCDGCINRCPVKARTFLSDVIKERVAMLEKNCADIRCEPETFL